jgi:hypothetical protein
LLIFRTEAERILIFDRMNPRPQFRLFMPSTLEHFPLIRAEKHELLKYLDEDGHRELGALRLSPFAAGEEMELLEAWIWGLRFWGREVLVRATKPVIRLQIVRWNELVRLATDDEVISLVEQKLLPGPFPQLDAISRWAEEASLKSATQTLHVHRPLPEGWLDSVPGPLHGRVTFWSAITGFGAMEAVFAHRDEAAQYSAMAATAGVRTLMLEGNSLPVAVSEVRAAIYRSLRQWLERNY